MGDHGSTDPIAGAASLSLLDPAYNGFYQSVYLNTEKTFMEFPVIITAVFGAFVVFGGIMGYVKAGSKASLIAGSITGGLLLVSAFLITRDITAGKILGIVVSLVLLAQFGPSLLKKLKVMPNLLIVVFGFLTVVTLALSF
ncbi:MAG: TMEM14 family protein [Pirellulaceae bacterium]